MGRVKKNFTISSKMIFTFLVIICVGLIIVSYLFADLLSPVRTAVGNFFVPMQKGISTVSSGISDSLRVFSDKQKLIEENDKLTAEINDMVS